MPRSIKDMIRQVLNAKGTMIQLNPITLSTIYEDDKLYLEGILNREGTKFVIYFAGVNLSSPAGFGQQVESNFGLPSNKRSNKTTVYQWEDVTRYSRSGRWLNYLSALTDEINRNQEEFMSLNHAEINDSKLFPNFEVADVADFQA